MKTQTVGETLEEASNRAYECGLFSTKTAFIAGVKWYKHHTTTQIEALRERLREKGIKKYGFEITEDEIDKVFNKFLKEIND